MDSSHPQPPKSRPVGGTEYSWCRAVPSGTGVTVLALLLSRPVDTVLLDAALHTLLTSHPIHGAVLTTTTNPHTISVPPSPHLPVLLISASDTADLLSRLSPPPETSHFHAILEHELNLNPWSSDPDGPVAFATAYELNPSCSSYAVVIRLHTSVCDRTSGVAVMKELLELMGGGAGGGEGEVIPGIEDLIPKKDSWKPFWARGKDLVGYSLNGLRSSALRFEDVGTAARSSEVVRMVMDEEETLRLLTACKAKGIKLSMALSAAGLIAVYASKNLQNNQAENYSVVTLIDCRRYLEPVLNEHDVGFYHSAITNTHSVGGGEGLWEMALRCHNAYSTAMSNKKHLTDIGELNFLMCKAIENPSLTLSSSLRTAVISVFEEPVIYESSELEQKLGVEDYVGCSSVHGVGPSIAIFDTIRDGRLDCACVYPSPLHSRKQIEELVEHMTGILTGGSHVLEDLER